MLVVIKLGGSILESVVPKSFLEDLKKMYQQGHQIVLIHGGGKTVSDVSRKMGKEPRFVLSPKGFRSRYSDKETIEIFAMAMTGRISKLIVSTILGEGLNAVGISGVEAGIVTAQRKKELLIVDENGRRRIIEGDYSGKITKVDPKLIQLLLEAKYLPVLSPIALGSNYELLNVDGDRLAAHVAGALQADYLILFTDVEGIVLDNKIVRTMDYIEAKELIPKIGHGMITKLYAALEALEMNVKEVNIGSGLRDNPITMAIEKKSGTLITYGDRR
jgi:acetylglutamate/LysW-gamma-L-alpha-aminoadipate kinase